jgi:magnesium transporter
MSIIQKTKAKAGFPPGTLIYTGNAEAKPVKIYLMNYDEYHLQEHEIEDCAECLSYKNSSTVSWININSIQNVEVIETIGKYFDIHPLVLEDLMSVNQRPKMENYDSYSFIVLRMLKVDEDNNQINDEQVSLIVGNNFVISFQEEGDVLDSIRNRIRENKGIIRKQKSDYLAYALIDTIVDNYFVILEKIEDETERIEEDLSLIASNKSLQEINILKRQIISIRKAIWPLREFIGSISKEESAIFSKNTIIYMRDVYDHTIRLIDMVDTLREVISDLTNLYLSSVSNRMNEIMKVLTIISTIFIPMTFLAGVYGMNFEFMPELRYRWGYPATLVVMLGIGIVMLTYFRKKRWL